VLSAPLCSVAVLCGAGADKIALHVGQAAEHGQHQSPGAGAGVGPRFRERAELRLGVRDALDDGKEVEGAARQPVDARHRHHVAGGEGLEQFEKLAAVAVRARHLLAVNLRTARAAKLPKLGVERLPVGADAGIAETAVLRFSFGLILCKPLPIDPADSRKMSESLSTSAPSGLGW